MKILILGANGQLGFELERALSIFSSVELATRNGEIFGMPCARIDLADLSQLEHSLDEKRPHVIINAAAYTQVDRAEDEPGLCRAINHDAVALIARKAKEINALLVHYSTDYVYSGNSSEPWLEQDNTQPASAYGKSKLAGDLAIIASRCAYRILRTQWVYAARGHNFLRTMLKLARAQQEQSNPPPLRIVADQIGAPTPARWLASATAAMVANWMRDLNPSHSNVGVYHVSAAGTCSWLEFASAIFADAKTIGLIHRVPDLQAISTQAYAAKAPRPLYSALSNRKLFHTFDLRMAHWREGLRQTLAEMVVS